VVLGARDAATQEVRSDRFAVRVRDSVGDDPAPSTRGAPVSEPVRIGLVGYGFGGRTFHAPLIASSPALALVGVVTTSDARAAQLAVDLPGVPAVRSLAELVDLGAEAVAISTATGSHTEVALEAIGLGLHVVVDKPLAVDAVHAAETVAAAEAAGVALSVYQNRRWDSDFLTVRRLLSDGALGDVHRYESRVERWSPVADPSTWKAGATPEQGGGLRLDLLTHLVDQAVQLFGEVETVYAELDARRPGSASDDDAFVALHHVSGVRSQCMASKVTGDTTRRIRVLGSQAAYVVGGFDGQEAALLGGRTPATEGDTWGVEDEGAWGSLHRGDEVVPVPSERGRWDTFYPAFAAAVRGEAPVPVDPRKAVRVLEILDAALVSSREQRVVDLR
jgi:predicted dehydrogenase